VGEIRSGAGPKPEGLGEKRESGKKKKRLFFDHGRGTKL
jgi:hypothetical protein